MASDAVWPILAMEGVVEVDVVGVVACARCCGPVACLWLYGMWFVEAHFGGGCVLFVGQWYDVSGWSVEPSTGSNAAS